MELYGGSNTLGTFEFILLNGHMKNNENELTNNDKQQLIQLAQNDNGRETLIRLIVGFAELYHIYLHFIAFHESKFQMINEWSFPDKIKQGQQAFIVLNGDYTVCGVLFSIGLDGRKQTVFPFDDMHVTSQVNKYIEELNRTGNVYFFLK
jgi:hypothetical protein